jgi:pyridoxamine 5'-phosphate oxidase
VRIGGSISRTSAEESAAYFKTRPRGSQLGAHTSAQSAVISDRAGLEQRHATLEAQYPRDVPLPDHWGGFRLEPETYEFWQGRESRLHDRLRYRRASGAGAAWIVERLSP